MIDLTSFDPGMTGKTNSATTNSESTGAGEKSDGGTKRKRGASSRGESNRGAKRARGRGRGGSSRESHVTQPGDSIAPNIKKGHSKAPNPIAPNTQNDNENPPNPIAPNTEKAEENLSGENLFVPQKISRKKSKKIDTVREDSMRVNQDLLAEVKRRAAYLTVEEQVQISSCLLSDFLGLPIVAGDFVSTSSFGNRALVPEVCRAMTRKKASDRVTKNRAERGVSAKSQRSESNVQRTETQVAVCDWTEQSVSMLLLLQDKNVLEDIYDTVAACVASDVSVDGFLARIRRAASQGLDQLGQQVVNIRAVTSIAEKQEQIKMYLAVAAALYQRTEGTKSVLQKFNASKKGCSVENLSENLELLLSRFSSKILFCLPFLSGFELELLCRKDPTTLEEITTRMPFESISELLNQNFKEFDQVLDSLFPK
jgi:hypothetical protein